MSRNTSKDYFSRPELWKPPVFEQLAVASEVCALVPSDVISILDAGCGNGAVTKMLRERWAVTAFDFSMAALQSVAPPRFNANIAAIPLQDKSFDLVVATDVLEHIPEEIYGLALAELSRVSRKYVLIAVPNLEILDHATIVCPACGNRYHAHHHLRTYNSTDTLTLLAPDFGARVLLERGDRWLFSNPEIVAAQRTASGLDYAFPDAVCNRCGARRGASHQDATASGLAARFDCLQALLVSNGHEKLPHRSEILGLFERGWEQPAITEHSNLPSTTLTEFRLADLATIPNPKPFPDVPLILETTPDNVLISFTRLPDRLEIVRGPCSSIEIYDERVQSYISCKQVSSAAYDFPVVAFKQHGVFVRLKNVSADTAIVLRYPEPWTAAEIREICFASTLQSKLEEEIARSNQLDDRRNVLEGLCQEKDKQLAELESALSRAHETANSIESRRDALEKVIAATELKLTTATGSNESLTIQLEKANRRISALHIVSRSSPVPTATNKVKSVLVLSHMYPRDYHPAGGIFVHEQVKALRLMGIDARVLSGEPFWINTLDSTKVKQALRSGYSSNNITWTEIDGVPLCRFPYIVSQDYLPFELHSFSYRIAMRKFFAAAIGEFDFDLVHAHTAYLDGAAGAALCSRLNKPLVITEHTGPFRTLTRNPWLRFWTGRAINRADKLLSVSSSLLGDIQSEIKLSKHHRAKIVPNLVDTTFFTPTPRRIRDHIVILWVGHFVEVKRVDRLLKAFRIAFCKDPRLRLKLVGDGRLKTPMESLCKELQMDHVVEFAGVADRAKLRDHYADCDLLVISSDTETFGLVSIEALACGRPVLATVCGGPSDVIVDSQLGCMVGRSEQALADGMLLISTNLDRYDPRLLHEYVELKFSASTIASTLARVYDETLSDYELFRRMH